MRNHNQGSLPSIPDKRYFSIGEASKLCLVKPHVLRFWQEEFPQFNPSKRKGNHRYYQLQDIEIAREIRRLLYQEGFTIKGARQQLTEFKKNLKAEKHWHEMKILLKETIRDLDEISKNLKL